MQGEKCSLPEQCWGNTSLPLAEPQTQGTDTGGLALSLGRCHRGLVALCSQGKTPAPRTAWCLGGVGLGLRSCPCFMAVAVPAPSPAELERLSLCPASLYGPPWL